MERAGRGKFDVALVAVLSCAAPRLQFSLGATLCAGMTAPAASLSSAPRPTPRPRTRWWPSPPAMAALSAIRPVGAGGDEKVFGLSESQIARRVKTIAKAAGLENLEFFSGHSGHSGRVSVSRRMARTAPPPTRSNARAAGNRAAAWWAYTRGESAGSRLRYL